MVSNADIFVGIFPEIIAYEEYRSKTEFTTLQTIVDILLNIMYVT